MTVEARWEPDLSEDNANELQIKGLANNAQNPVKIRTNFSFSTGKKHKTYIIKLSNLFTTPLITLVCINNLPLKRIPLYALTNKKISFKK